MWKKKTETKYPDSVEKAYDYAMFLLGLKLRTEGELREKMKGRKYKPEVMDTVIVRLTENRYINDRNYAEVYLENLKKYKTFGFYGIKKKLMEKRLPSEIIESVLSEGLSEDEEIKIAKRLIKKNTEYSTQNTEEDLDTDVNEPVYVDKFTKKNTEHGTQNTEENNKQKLAQKLKSRGFRGSVISKLIF